MAMYTAFMTSLNLIPPSSDDDGATWKAHVSCDVVMLDSDGVPVAPWGMEMPWAAFVTLNSTDPIVPSDTISTLKQKMMAVIRPNFAPTITAADFVRVVWLDSGGLLNL